MTPRVAALAFGLALAGCDRADMVAQPKSSNWDRSAFFPNGSSMREPIPGTVPRDEPNQPVPQPTAITEALLSRGQQRYGIFCTPCHGESGDGRGMIVERGFPQPPPLWADRLIRAKAADLYATITHGHGAMYSYADRVPPADRWAIVAYVRALQQSQNAAATSLPAADRQALELAR